MNPGVMRWPASKRLMAGYALAFSLLVVNSVVTFWNLRAIAGNSRDVAQTHEVLVGLEAVLSNLRDAEIGQRGYLLTGDEPYLAPYHQARSMVGQSVDSLKKITANNGIRQDHISLIEQATAEKFDELKKTIKLRREQGIEAAFAVVKTDRGMALMNELRKRIGEMAADENVLRDRRRPASRPAITRTILTFSLVSTLALTLLFAVHYLNERSRRS